MAVYGRGSEKCGDFFIFAATFIPTRASVASILAFCTRILSRVVGRDIFWGGQPRENRGD